MVVDADDSVRPDSSIDKLAQLKPYFKAGGSVTAGNSCQVTPLPMSALVTWPACHLHVPARSTSFPCSFSLQNTDCAAAVLLMKRSEARRRGLPIMAALRSFAVVGVPPAIMGTGPAVAVPEALRRAGLSKDDIDIFELNEAFGSQVSEECRKEEVEWLSSAVPSAWPPLIFVLHICYPSLLSRPPIACVSCTCPRRRSTLVEVALHLVSMDAPRQVTCRRHVLRPNVLY